MALTEAELQARRKGIGGSDAKVIVGNDSKAWAALKDEKINDVRTQFDPDSRFRMDLGTAVEPVILDRLHDQAVKLTTRGKSVSFEAAPRFRCTLDAETVHGFPVETKFHTGAKTIDELVDFYFPQLQHTLLVTGASSLFFAVAFGMYGRFEFTTVSQDAAYQNAYLERGLMFVQYCWHDGPLPEGMTASGAVGTVLAPSVPRVRHHVWPTGNNEIADLAGKWLENADKVAIFTKAAADLKEATPRDATTATWLGADGVGIKITINKAGAKSIKPHVQRG